MSIQRDQLIEKEQAMLDDMAEYRDRNKKLGDNMKNYEKLKLDMSQKINKLLKEKSEFESERKEFYENKDIEMSSPLKPMGQSTLDAEQYKIEEEKQSLLDLQVKLVKKEEELKKSEANVQKVKTDVYSKMKSLNQDKKD